MATKNYVVIILLIITILQFLLLFGAPPAAASRHLPPPADAHVGLKFDGPTPSDDPHGGNARRRGP
ncbi:hypothetical protein LINPERHAP1_LOCUS42152 [Linum perenne]